MTKSIYRHQLHRDENNSRVCQWAVSIPQWQPLLASSQGRCN